MINPKYEPRHFYVFSFKDGNYFYNRTCGTVQAAKDWVERLGPHAIYMVDNLPKKWFY